MKKLSMSARVFLGFGVGAVLGSGKMYEGETV